MRGFICTAFLLCAHGWVSVSGSEYQTVDAEPGDDVTLRCSNISTMSSQTDWFRLVNRTKPSCISSMFSSNFNAAPCDGFGNGKFHMTSNGTAVFLQIKSVDLSDSGLYFCGFYIKANTIIETAIHLNIKGDAEADEAVDSMTQNVPGAITNLVTVTVGCLAVIFMIAVIVLTVKIRKLQKAATEELHLERNQHPGSADVLKFLPSNIRNRRPESKTQVETNVMYLLSSKTRAASETTASQCN